MFLTELGEVLKAQEGADAELAEIVAQHILAAAPAEGCVEQALKAITALAAERASPPKVNADG